jgi:hypothetical protein
MANAVIAGRLPTLDCAQQLVALPVGISYTTSMVCRAGFHPSPETVSVAPIHTCALGRSYVGLGLIRTSRAPVPKRAGLGRLLLVGRGAGCCVNWGARSANGQCRDCRTSTHPRCAQRLVALPARISYTTSMVRRAGFHPSPDTVSVAPDPYVRFGAIVCRTRVNSYESGSGAKEGRTRSVYARAKRSHWVLERARVRTLLRSRFVSIVE